MRSKIEPVANILAVTIWADGEFDDQERTTVGEIASTFGFGTLPFQKSVEGAVGSMLKSDDDKVNNILQKSAAEVLDSERAMVFEGAMEIAFSNSLVDYDIISRLLTVADALGIEDDEAITMIVDMVNEVADVDSEEIVGIVEGAADFDAEVKAVVELCDKIHDPESFVVEK